METERRRSQFQISKKDISLKEQARLFICSTGRLELWSFLYCLSTRQSPISFMNKKRQADVS